MQPSLAVHKPGQTWAQSAAVSPTQQGGPQIERLSLTPLRVVDSVQHLHSVSAAVSCPLLHEGTARGAGWGRSLGCITPGWGRWTETEKGWTHQGHSVNDCISMYWATNNWTISFAAMYGPRGYHTKWSKSDKDKYHMISLTCGIQKNEDLENKLTVTKGESVGGGEG